MARDLLRDPQEGRFFRGNLHCHSNRSDGLREPEEVVGAYRGAGYDFLCLSDHFEAECGWRVTDTRSSRDEGFTTILGAELSTAPWDERDCFWVTAAGLPPEFEAPPAEDHAEAIRRARDVGAFVVMLHPGLNNLPLFAAERSPALEAVDAVEVYNHHAAMAVPSDRAHGAYMLDGLLEAGRRVLVNAGDDAHFCHPWTGSAVGSRSTQTGSTRTPCSFRSRTGTTTRRRGPSCGGCSWKADVSASRRARCMRSR